MKITEIIGAVDERVSFIYYPLFYTADQLASREMLKADEEGLCDKPDDELSDRELKKKKFILTHDAPFFVIELLQYYLRLNHPDAKLETINSARKGKIKITLENMTYLDSEENIQLQKLLEAIKEDLKEADKDPEAAYDNLFCTPCFVMKDLFLNDSRFNKNVSIELLYKDCCEAFMRVQEEDTPENRAELERCEQQMQGAVDRYNMIFDPKRFKALCAMTINGAERIRKLAIYSKQLEEQSIKELAEMAAPCSGFIPDSVRPQSDVARNFCINATNEEFSQVIEQLKEQYEHKPLPKGMEYVRSSHENSFYNTMTPDQKKDGAELQWAPVKISGTRSDIEVYVEIEVLDASKKNEVYLDATDIDLLDAVNTRYIMNERKDVVIYIAELYKDLNSSNTNPTPKQRVELEARVGWLASLWVRRRLRARNKKTGEVRVLDAEHLENLEYFQNLPGYTFELPELLLAIDTARLLKIDHMRPYLNPNRSISHGFILESQPTLHKLADEKGQGYNRDLSILKNSKSTRNRYITRWLERELQYDDHKWIYNATDFLLKIKVIDKKAEMRNKDRKRNLLNGLESCLGLLCSIGAIADYDLISETGDFVIYPALPDASKAKTKKERAKVRKILNKRDHDKIRADLKARLESGSRKVFTQRIGNKGTELTTLNSPTYIESKTVELKTRYGDSLGWIVKGKLA